MSRAWALVTVLWAGWWVGCEPVPPQPPPPTTTTTTLYPACYAPVPGPAGDYVPAPWQAPRHLQAVLDAEARIGAGCWPHEEDIPLEFLAVELRTAGLCAVRNEDRVLVSRPDGLYEEHHVIAYTTGCWAKYPYRGILRWDGAYVERER
jgi:hypothetical protein